MHNVPHYQLGMLCTFYYFIVIKINIIFAINFVLGNYTEIEEVSNNLTLIGEQFNVLISLILYNNDLAKGTQTNEITYIMCSKSMKSLRT